MRLPKVLQTTGGLLVELSLNFKKEAVLKILEIATPAHAGSSTSLFALQFTGVQEVRSDIPIRLPAHVQKLVVRRGGSATKYVAQMAGGTLQLTAKTVKTTVDQDVPVIDKRKKKTGK